MHITVEQGNSSGTIFTGEVLLGFIIGDADSALADGADRCGGINGVRLD
ncbi:MAG: hypothetical protein Q7U33_05630 [Methylotenera sp.]|nr:hypothetical protein [Methylotenera sp.]